MGITDIIKYFLKYYTFYTLVSFAVTACYSLVFPSSTFIVNGFNSYINIINPTIGACGMAIDYAKKNRESH